MFPADADQHLNLDHAAAVVVVVVAKVVEAVAS
jgi:hypothetical protein